MEKCRWRIRPQKVPQSSNRCVTIWNELGVHTRRVEFLIVTGFRSGSGVFSWQQHRAGTIGPGTPPKDRGAGSTNLVDVYDPATDSWKLKLKPMPTARSGMAVTVMDNKIFVFGGRNQGEPSIKVRFTIRCWTLGQSSPRCRCRSTVLERLPLATLILPAGATLKSGTAQTNGTRAFALKEGVSR